MRRDSHAARLKSPRMGATQLLIATTVSLLMAARWPNLFNAHPSLLSAVDRTCNNITVFNQCNDIEFPYGVSNPTQMFPQGLLSYAVNSVFPAVNASSIVYMSHVVAVFVIAFIASQCLGFHYAAAWIATIFYFMSDVPFTQASLNAEVYAATLTPAVVLTSIVFATRSWDHQWRQLFKWALVAFSLFLYAIATSGYLYFFGLITLVGATLIRATISFGLPANGRPRVLVPRLIRSGGIPFAAIASAFAAGRVYQTLTSGGPDTTTTMPLDFYRGAGLDLLYLLLPHEKTLAGAALERAGLTIVRSGEAGLGNPYLGIVALVLAAVLGLRFYNKKTIIAGFLGLLFLSLISLGPSLKLDNPIVWSPTDGEVSFSDYLMSESEARFVFPWAFAFTETPLAYARAVWRWQYPIKFLTIWMAIHVACEGLKTKSGKKLAVAIGVFVLVEQVSFPAVSNWSQLPMGEARHNMASTMIVDLSELSMAIGDGRPVIFAPMSNDFASGAMAAVTGGRLFNTSGDRALALHRSRLPSEIRMLNSSYGELDPFVSAIKAAVSSGIVDYVVLSKFHLRWDTTRWPPPESERTTRRWSFALKVHEVIADDCLAVIVPWAVVISECFGPEVVFPSSETVRLSTNWNRHSDTSSWHEEEEFGRWSKDVLTFRGRVAKDVVAQNVALEIELTTLPPWVLPTDLEATTADGTKALISVRGSTIKLAYSPVDGDVSVVLRVPVYTPCTATFSRDCRSLGLPVTSFGWNVQ